MNVEVKDMVMRLSVRSSLGKVLLLSLLLAPAVHARQANVAEARRLFQTPPDDSRIMMRWWWFGPSVTREEVEREMRRMKEGGIGGFELAVVYPMALDDPAHGFHNYPYLSPEYLDVVRFVASKAREL